MNSGVGGRPLFSVVIPTLRRPDTLEHTLATVCAQPERSLEIVVQNNGADPPTGDVVRRLADPRIRHCTTPSVISMPENWELALANARGEWITFIGDDDGLLADGCALARRVLATRPVELLSWHPLTYYWPAYFEPARANRLEGIVDSEVLVRNVACGPLLQRFYAFEVDYSNLPMIYNSFLRRSLVNRIREAHGQYFFGSFPDVTSGIIDAACSESFLLLTRPLSISGLSHHSTGHNWFFRPTARNESETLRDFPAFRSGQMLPGAQRNLAIALGSEMLTVRDQLGDRSLPLELDPAGLIRSVARSLNADPDRYHETRELIEGLRRHFKIDPAEVAIPDRTAVAPVPPVGVHQLDHRRRHVVVDAGAEGARSIADAVRIASGLIPAPDRLKWTHTARLHKGVPVAEEPLSFGDAGTGLDALVSGWASPEPWGTWSVGAKSVIRFMVPEPLGSLVRLGLEYRTLPLPDGETRQFVCSAGGRKCEWRFGQGNFQGQMVIELPVGGSGVLEMVLTNPDPRSPAEMSLSPDPRPIGLGLQRIWILSDEGQAGDR